MEVFGIKGLLRLLRHESGFRLPRAPLAERHAKTSFSATVFSGESQQWVSYLQASRTNVTRPTFASGSNCSGTASN